MLVGGKNFRGKRERGECEVIVIPTKGLKNRGEITTENCYEIGQLENGTIRLSNSGKNLR
jgi:hypothetical protein